MVNKITYGVAKYRSNTTNDVVRLRKKLVGGIGRDMTRLGRMMR